MLVPGPTNESSNLPEVTDACSGLGMLPCGHDAKLSTEQSTVLVARGGADGADLYLNHKAIGRGIKEVVKRGVKG